MCGAGLDALVVTSQRNFEYVTGYRTPAWLIKSRPMAVVLPASGAPIAVVSDAHAVELEAQGLVRRIRPYAGLERAATDALLSTLREEGLASASLGFEMGTEQRLGIPLAEFRRLCDGLPKAGIRDGGGVLWSARIRKSEAEIAYLREGGRIAGTVYESLIDDIRPGWTERQVLQEFTIRAVEEGADAPGYVTMTGGRAGYHRHNESPRDRAFARGELFWIDVGLTFRGYFSDYTRCAALGAASPMQQEQYRLVLEILDEALAAVRGGVSARSVVAVAVAASRRNGAELRFPSRLGHGLGLDLTEPPSLTEDEEITLESGMVLTVEPGMLTSEGWCHLEENVVVRDGGCEFLSARMPRELPIVGD
jgi:Xaa-Pro dipeptidase